MEKIDKSRNLDIANRVYLAGKLLLSAPMPDVTR
jgi:hypothetical protein